MKGLRKLTIRIDDRLDELAHRLASGDLQVVRDLTHADPASIDLDTVLDVESLQGLARLCDARHLHVEAARIRRWLGSPEMPDAVDPVPAKSVSGAMRET